MDRLRRYWWAAGLAIAALVVVILAPLASADPDGLERVAQDLGFIDRGTAPGFQIIPDYAFPGVDDPAISTIAAGLVGVVIVFVLMVGLGRLLRARRAR